MTYATAISEERDTKRHCPGSPAADPASLLAAVLSWARANGAKTNGIDFRHSKSRGYYVCAESTADGIDCAMHIPCSLLFSYQEARRQQHAGNGRVCSEALAALISVEQEVRVRSNVKLQHARRWLF